MAGEEEKRTVLRKRLRTEQIDSKTFKKKKEGMKEGKEERNAVVGQHLRFSFAFDATGHDLSRAPKQPLTLALLRIHATQRRKKINPGGGGQVSREGQEPAPSPF